MPGKQGPEFHPSTGKKGGIEEGRRKNRKAGRGREGKRKEEGAEGGGVNTHQ